MKTFACSHKDLTALLSPLKATGVFIDELPDKVLVIRENWHTNTGDEIFRASPTGRKGDEIWYQCNYGEKFDAAMNTMEH